MVPFVSLKFKGGSYSSPIPLKSTTGTVPFFKIADKSVVMDSMHS